MGLMKVIYILCIIHYKYCIVSQIPNNNPKQTNENKQMKTNENKQMKTQEEGRNDVV